MKFFLSKRNGQDTEMRRRTSAKQDGMGILCLCTGEYKMFWESFYASFRENFAVEIPKTFYVFTDDTTLAKGRSDIVPIPIEDQPWPLITLLRFHYIEKHKAKFETHRYLAFCNVNLLCIEQLGEAELLPDEAAGERMAYVLQPWYVNAAPKDCPFCRDKNSQAYISEETQARYVMGSLFLGRTQEFLTMVGTLKGRITTDLQKNIIAVWHDESHLNWYVANASPPYKLLDPSYMYPEKTEGWSWGLNEQYTEKICYLRKANVMDILELKGKKY